MGKAKRGGKSQGEYDHIVVVPDVQYPFHHKRAEASLMQYVDAAKPDKLVQIGDFFDFFSLADFRKKLAPSSRIYFKREVEGGRKKLREWAACSPTSKRTFILGNHEARLARYLETRAPELFDLCDELSVSRLLQCDEAGWDVVGPYGEGMWAGKPGGLWLTHGNYCSEGAITKMLKLLKCSFAQGHSHRLRMMAETSSLTGRTIAGYEIGSLCNAAKTPKNMPYTNWQLGFLDGWVHKRRKTFHMDLVSIGNDGKFVIRGEEYRG